MSEITEQMRLLADRVKTPLEDVMLSVIVSMAKAAARHHFNHITIKPESLTAEELEFACEHIDWHVKAAYAAQGVYDDKLA